MTSRDTLGGLFRHAGMPWLGDSFNPVCMSYCCYRCGSPPLTSFCLGMLVHGIIDKLYHHSLNPPTLIDRLTRTLVLALVSASRGGRSVGVLDLARQRLAGGGALDGLGVVLAGDGGVFAVEQVEGGRVPRLARVGSVLGLEHPLDRRLGRVVSELGVEL